MSIKGRICPTPRLRTLRRSRSTSYGPSCRKTARPSNSSSPLRVKPRYRKTMTGPPITHCVERIARAGLEVVVVDVTSPDISECGLHVFRAIIPGAQPLYFGSGLHRISVRATSAEYADRASKQINLHPHPFP
ncbi:MAG: hypothetical protein E5V26_01810 [Mesorhizobium sp.]|nr:MAG: hypothetical protein E5V26_01810 [Mesorhizobium sp.]